MNRWIRCTVEAPRALEEELAAELCRRGALGVQVEPVGEPGGEPLVRVSAFFADTDPGPLRASIHGILADGPFPGGRIVGLDQVADGRWAERWFESLRPFDVGRRFRIVPVADAAGPAAPVQPESGGRLHLPVCPSRAFGTGEHPTTRTCLELLEPLDLRGRSLLDVGTGSGILAMAAAGLGASPVVALDNDQEAIRVARGNARMLPAAGCIRFLCGGMECLGEASFHAIVANLNGALLERILPDLRDRLAPAGTLILSGLLEEEAGPMDARLRRAGLRTLEIRIDSGWAGTMHVRGDA